MKTIILLLGFVALIESAYGLTCPCHKDVDFTCTDEPTEASCSYGRVDDACKCCKECAKGPEEQCGGPWGVSGTCAEGYTCVKVPGGYEDSLGFEGKCQNATDVTTTTPTEPASSTTPSSK
ncbi:venom protein 302-like [Macrobrachium rosenbergii]|uniref:venom protein 302-like n=1 Tax=Macrobrachium rosenbergii TaxID=79674 RepID=UPI0034D45385